jgi:hypothetical protein
MAATEKATWILANKGTSLVWKVEDKLTKIFMMTFTFLLVIYSLAKSIYLNPKMLTKAQACCWLQLLLFCNLVFYSMMWPHYLNPTKAEQWSSQPAAGCSFYHSACYLFYDVASLPESYES